MNIPQPLIEAYSRLSSILDVVEERVMQALVNYARPHMYPVIGRKKTIESLAEKIETGRFASFGDIDDLVAFTLIVPHLEHEAKVVDHCRSLFDISTIRQRSSSKKAPDVFRFDSARLYGRLMRPSGHEVDGDISIFDVTFELQIRTAFEHAWIVGTHPLVYKTPIVDWGRARLAAQMKAAVEQLDLTLMRFDSLSEGMSASPWPGVSDRKEVAGLMIRLVEEGVVPVEAGPKDVSRFCDNFLEMIRASKKKLGLVEALGIVESGLRSMGHDGFPRSVTMLQVCMALLHKDGALSGPLQKYTCHITPQLKNIFPGIEALRPVFRYGD